MIKVRRVGNISMAVVLISFGGILFFSQLSKISALNIATKIWPVILIMLGLEILWCRYVSKDENTAIKYDLLSIFTVLIILFVNTGIYAVQETGLMHRLQQELLSQHYTMDVELQEYTVDAGINKIIVHDVGHLSVRASKDKNIGGFARLNIYAAGKKEAETLTALEHIKYKRSGDTLHVYPISNTSDNYSYSGTRDMELFIPGDVDIEITDCYNLDLVYSDFNNGWTLDRVNSINIRLEKDSDVRVNAFVSSLDYLNGNIKWSFNKFGEYVNGNGDNLINILNGSTVTVNEV